MQVRDKGGSCRCAPTGAVICSHESTGARLVLFFVHVINKYKACFVFY